MAMLSGIIRTEETQLLEIARIRRDGGTQPRQGMNEDVVTDYVAALANSAEFPPVDVMFDGQVYWLFDGFHRVESHLRSGRTEIQAKVHNGSLEEAQWRSYAANQSHGLRRNTADKERAIRAALKHPKAQAMSDNALAKHLGVSDKTVTKYRAEMEAASEIPKVTARSGADGKTYNVANIGKRPAAPPTPAPAAAAPAPQLRPLTTDETIALIWRVVKALPASMMGQTARWQNYLSWLQAHSAPGDYRSQVPEGARLDSQILTNARATIMAELERNLEHEQRTQQRQAQMQKELPEELAKLGCELRAERGYFFVKAPDGTMTTCGSYINAIEWLNQRVQQPPQKPSIAAQVIEMAKEMDAEIQAILAPTGSNGPSVEAPAVAPASDPPGPARRELADTAGDETERNGQIGGLLNMLEAVLTAINENYGDLTGHYTHIPPARHALEPMIAKLKENLV